MPCQRKCKPGTCLYIEQLDLDRHWTFAIERVQMLTTREREIFMLLGRELSNGCIAILLSITERTVKEHVKNVVGKLGLDSKAEAAVVSALHRERLSLGAVDR